MHQRKHIRLREFDYSSANSYFITICAKQFENVFGEINNGIMGLSDVGNTAAVFIQTIQEKRPYVLVDEFVVMPNHVHCILDIQHRLNDRYNKNGFGKPIANSVSTIINRYKGAVKRWCALHGYNNFEWQPRFYDHVIRNTQEYWVIKNYIINNPRNWDQDKFRGS